MSDIWTSLDESFNSYILDLFVCVSESKMLQVRQENPFKSTLPVKMSPVYFESQQRMLIVSKDILKVNISQEMPIYQFL